MEEKSVNQKKSGDLRKKAEEKLRRLTSKPLHELSASDSHNLIHELQVHQIELEMQNEELRAAQAALEDSRSKYSDLYDFAPIGYLTFDKNGLILEANLTAAEQLGIERSSLIKKPFSVFIHKDDQDVFYTHRQNVLKSSTRHACEIRIKRKDDSVFYAQLVSSAAQDSEDNYSLIRTAVSNITERRKIEEALKESEELHRITLTNISDAVFITDDDGKLTFICPNVAFIFGYSYDDVNAFGYISVLLGKDLFDLKELKASGEIENIEREVLDKSGRKHSLLINVKNVSIKGGTVLYACRDITERRKAEEVIKAKQDLNELLLNAIPHPAMLINTKRIVQAANKRALDIGVKLGDYCWKEFGKCEYLSAEDKKRAEEKPDDEGIKCTFCLADQAMKGSRLKKMNDPEVHAFDRIWDTYWDPIDKNTFLHYAIDITERKEAEEEIKKHREHLMELVDERTSELQNINEELEREIAERTRVENQLKLMALFAELSPSPVLRFNDEGKVLMANPAAVEIFGLGSLTGIKLTSLIPGIESFDFAARIYDGTIFSHSAQIGDRFFHFIVRGLSDLKIGQIYGSDVTEQKKAEARTMRTSHLIALGELAAGVAHEINNPINGIINYSQILLNKSIEGSKEYDIAKRVIKEGDRIADIVSSLLSFARDRKEAKHPVSIHEIMSNSLALIELQLRKDGIELRIDIPPDLPYIIAHPQQIQQVFLNIISNSRYALNQKYNGAHEDKILEIIAETIMIDDDPYVQTTFFDKGHGISTGIMDKIMNPFFTTKPSGIGTGLGLSISHGIINDHGGRITLDSAEGEFTKIRIDIPQTGKIDRTDD
jgi:PAS domain S-box-containing protein